MVVMSPSEDMANDSKVLSKTSLQLTIVPAAWLANAAGIQGEWWEVNGTRNVVSVEAKRALLAALELPPPRPAAWGMCLLNVIFAPLAYPA